MIFLSKTATRLSWAANQTRVHALCRQCLSQKAAGLQHLVLVVCGLPTSQTKATEDKHRHLLVQPRFRALVWSLMFPFSVFQEVYLKLAAPTVETWLRITRARYAQHWRGKGNTPTCLAGFLCFLVRLLHALRTALRSHPLCLPIFQIMRSFLTSGCHCCSI